MVLSHGAIYLGYSSNFWYYLFSDFHKTKLEAFIQRFDLLSLGSQSFKVSFFDTLLSIVELGKYH